MAPDAGFECLMRRLDRTIDVGLGCLGHAAPFLPGKRIGAGEARAIVGIDPFAADQHAHRRAGIRRPFLAQSRRERNVHASLQPPDGNEISRILGKPPSLPSQTYPAASPNSSLGLAASLAARPGI